jgi:hypothetical protein
MPFDHQADGVQLYRSHKQVRAAKIRAVHGPKTVAIEPLGRLVTFDPKNRPVPISGMYCVFYDDADGYISFSPAKAFEDGYSPIEET